jgi:GNAT superfamily N-acetyltransferase
MYPAEAARVTLTQFTRTQDVITLLASAHPQAMLRRALGTRLRSETLALGLRRDLHLPHEPPAAKVPLVVRPLAERDDLSMLDIEQPGLTTECVLARLAERRLLYAELPTCWVALGPDGKVCYLQWLMTSRENHRIREQWGDLFPALNPDEALLEGAYTGEAYRGQGIMGYAMSRIAAAAQECGVRWVNTFVGNTNIASLKGCKKAGFTPHLQRMEAWRLMRRRVIFTRLPVGTRYAFD